MLDTIQKKSNAEKNSIENNMKLSINNLEQKYQKQVITVLKQIQFGIKNCGGCGINFLEDGIFFII